MVDRGEGNNEHAAYLKLRLRRARVCRHNLQPALKLGLDHLYLLRGSLHQQHEPVLGLPLLPQLSEL